MATVGNMYPTLSDMKKMEVGDDIATIIDMLVQYNAMYEDAPFLECNMGASHLTTVRTGLPTPTWRKLYKGVTPTKGTTTQVKDATGMLEDWSEVDAKMVELSKNPAKYRLSEAKAHIAGMANMLGTTVYYGDTDVNPERFTGLHARFNSKSAGNGKQIALAARLLFEDHLPKEILPGAITGFLISGLHPKVLRSISMLRASSTA